MGVGSDCPQEGLVVPTREPLGRGCCPRVCPRRSRLAPGGSSPRSGRQAPFLPFSGVPGCTRKCRLKGDAFLPLARRAWGGLPAPDWGSHLPLPGRPGRPGPSRKAPTAPHPSVCTAPRREQVRLRDLRPGCRISHTKVDDPYEAGYPAMTGLRPGMRQVSKGLFLFKQRPFPPRRWFGFRDLWPQPCGGHKAPTSTEAVTPATSRRFSRRASGRHSLLPKTIPTRPQLPFCVPSS